MTSLNDQLRSLAAKGGKAESEHLDLDWSYPGPRLAIWQRPIACGIVNQFVGGEEATARLCAAVAPQVDLQAARDCLLVQVEDERRHADMYRRYLARLNGRPSQQNLLDDAVTRSLSWKGAPEAALLAFHVIVEGEALAFQETARNHIPDPLFDAMSRQIAKDEARHIAFGRLYLSQSLPHLPLQERIEIYRWLRALWFEGTARLSSGPLGKIIATAMPRRWMQKRWEHWHTALEAAGLFDGAEASDFPVS